MGARYPTTGNGKGDKSRVSNKKAYDESWERVFGKKKRGDNDQEEKRNTDGTDADRKS